MSPKLHLYLSSGSCAMASHIILQESGLPYTTTDFQMRARGGFPAEQLHLNAKGRVPILDMDGELITEGLAIVSTIAALVPSKNLLGATILERARALEWLSYITGTVHGQGFGMIFKQSRFIDDTSAHPAVKEKGKNTVKDCFKYIDGKLEGKKFAVGEGFTAVDAYLLVIFSWGNLMQFGMKENYPNFSRNVEETLQRDSVKTALADEGVTVKVV